MRAKNVAIGLVLLAGTGIAGATYVWRQATALPEWYVEGEVSAEEDRPTSAAPEPEAGMRAEQPALRGGVAFEHDPPSPSAGDGFTAPRSKSTAPPRREVRQFHRRGLPPGTRTPVKASRATLDGEHLEAGVVLDLSNIPRDQLTPHDRALYDRAILAFPALARRDVYVGIEDEPRSDGKVLRLGPNPKIRVGNLRYSLAKAAEKLGIPPDELRREFDRELARIGLQPDSRTFAER